MFEVYHLNMYIYTRSICTYAKTIRKVVTIKICLSKNDDKFQIFHVQAQLHNNNNWTNVCFASDCMQKDREDTLQL